MVKWFSVGELTIFGTAKFEATNNACTVYADWNDSTYAKGDTCWVEF
jgi:hypothetical protein